MSQKTDDEQALKPKDLVFILAIAGRIDAQSRILAEQLDKERYVYYGYAALDSLSSSYSMFKYFFDICISGNNDAMHDMMMTPAGIIGITLESLFLVTFSVLAVKFENESTDVYKKFIAAAWPYFRDVIKGLKNAYKGWRSVAMLSNLLGGVDLNYLIAPIGLALGILAAANRLLLRYLTEERKEMMRLNVNQRTEIKNLLSLTREESFFYINKIKYQSETKRFIAFIAMGAGGFVDGLYLYVGVLGLAALSFPMLSALVAICAIYTVSCIITRIYEEYDFQVRLFITQTKCMLDLVAKETETTYAQLLSLQEKLIKSEDDLFAIHLLKDEMHSLLERFEEHRKVLTQQSTRTYFSSSLLGIKNGLYAYGAFSSVIFLAGSVLTLFGIAFPPALLIVSVTAGLAFMTAFIIYSLTVNYKFLNEKKDKVDRPYDLLIEIKHQMYLDSEINKLPKQKSFRQALDDGFSVDSSPQLPFQEWLEVIRSLFSGFGKGQKFVDFAGNPLMEPDEQGHYHDSPVMYILALFSALLFGGTLGLRALARGFGRVPLGQEKTAANEEQVIEEDAVAVVEKSDIKDRDLLESVTDNKTAIDVTEQQPLESPVNPPAIAEAKVEVPSIQKSKPRTDSEPRSYSLLHTFFGKKIRDGEKKEFPRSGSNPSLVSLIPAPGYTIQGLE